MKITGRSIYCSLSLIDSFKKKDLIWPDERWQLIYNGQDCGFVLSESENQWPETYAENIEGFFEEMNDSETGAFGFDIGSSLNVKYLRFEGSLTYE